LLPFDRADARQLVEQSAAQPAHPRLADVFGELIDLSYAGGTDTAATTWKVGEDTPMASLDGRRGVLPVVSSGRVVGLVTARRTAGIVAEQMDPVLPADIVAASAPLAEVVALVRRNGRTIIVVGGTATVVGLIHPEDLQGDVLSEFEEI